MASTMEVLGSTPMFPMPIGWFADLPKLRLVLRKRVAGVSVLHAHAVRSRLNGGWRNTRHNGRIRSCDDRFILGRRSVIGCPISMLSIVRAYSRSIRHQVNDRVRPQLGLRRRTVVGGKADTWQQGPIAEECAVA